MASIRAPWAGYIDQQHRLPSGPVGQLIGRRMLGQHAPETTWSIGLLNLLPADRVLELGFGAGRGLALTLERVPYGRVVGVDLSPTMVRAAAQRNRAAIQDQRLALICGTLTGLPFEGQVFDKIFSVHTFYFWPDPHAICAQLGGLLAPGGRLISTFATARRRRDGSWQYWDIQQVAEGLVQAFAHSGYAAQLLEGPISRNYNNVAVVIDRKGAN